MSQDSNVRGRFFWYELMTDDVPAAQAFYTNVVGWTIQPMEMEGMVYDMWNTPNGPIGGVANPAEMNPAGGPVPPHWLGHIGTPDVDATVARAVALGATLLGPTMDVPTVGRMAFLADPQGAVFSAYQPTSVMPEMDGRAPGAIAWHELYTTDVEAAWSFYTELFGWVLTGSMDMGPMGEYRMFGPAADKPIGGFMKKPADDPFPARWLYYASVTDLTGCLARTRELGGQVLWGPMEVPGGDTVATILDPQGAMFAIFQVGKARA